MAQSEPLELSIRAELIADVVVARISGQVRGLAAERLREELERIAEESYHKLILDLTGVTFISSAGLEPIEKAYRRARDTHGYVRFVNPQHAVQEVLASLEGDLVPGPRLSFCTVEEALEAD
ncbi:MAG: STAS domain-containing protein [Planctomycetota bacterium]|jgi:anti-anti-sigma factor